MDVIEEEHVHERESKDSPSDKEPEAGDPFYSFRPSVNVDEGNRHPSINPDRTYLDETLRLYDSMPKGFANFLEFGPSRRVSDAMDYEKLSMLHIKKQEYMKEQNIPLMNRAKDLTAKHLELQMHIKNFEPMIQEVNRKTKEARIVFQQSSVANKELANELPKARQALDILKEKRNRIINQVIKYEKAHNFINWLIKYAESQFDSFNAIVDRNFTLVTTNRQLMKRYMDRHQIQEALAEEVKVTYEFEKTHSIFLRHHITELRKELNDKVRSNNDLELKCERWSENTTDRALMLYRMRASILSMTELVLKMRPFMSHKLDGVTEPYDMIGLIGGFIVDYSEILRRLKIKLRQQYLEAQKQKQQQQQEDDFY